MRTCGILSALLLTVIAVPALAVSVLYNGVAQTILVSPSFVASLDPNSMQLRYQQIAPYIVHNALTEPESPDSLLTALFPDATTRTTVRQILPDIIAQHAEATPDTLTQAFDAHLTAVIMQTFRDAPPCTVEGDAAMMATVARNQLPSLECAPTTAAMQQQVIDGANQVIRQAFDQISAVQPLFRYTTQDVANRINEARAGAGQSLILPATLIIMVVALAVRSRRQLFGWVSTLLLATAIIGMLLTYAIRLFTPSQLTTVMIQDLPTQAEILLPVIALLSDSAFPAFITWSPRTFLLILGSGITGGVIALVLPKPVTTKPRTSQPLGPQTPIIGDGSTNRVKTDYETDAILTNPGNTLQLPPGLDTSKLTFGRRLPKIPQPTQQITASIPKGDHTSSIPVDGQTETLEPNTHTQELGPKDDSRATQRTDEHRF